jgi:hypothetical protein
MLLAARPTVCSQEIQREVSPSVGVNVREESPAFHELPATWVVQVLSRSVHYPTQLLSPETALLMTSGTTSMVTGPPTVSGVRVRVLPLLMKFVVTSYPGSHC